MKSYLGFPRRLRHAVPHWVEGGAIFHIRIALDREEKQNKLTSPELAESLLFSVAQYEQTSRWHVRVFVLMPDHLHALISFAPDKSISSTVADWKRFHARKNKIIWQEGYFDHRLRNDECGVQLESKAEYIRRNPVAAGLCERPEDWPWTYPKLE